MIESVIAFKYIRLLKKIKRNMSIKNGIVKSMADSNLLLTERYRAATFTFIVGAFVFFTLYIVSTKYDSWIFLLPYSYVVFLIGSVFFIYFWIKSKWNSKVPNALFLVLLVVLLIFASILATPFLLEEGIIPQ